jgi:5-(carboxyamino)imidazole ribonucleotide mutase
VSGKNTKTKAMPLVSVIVGSSSDEKVMTHCLETLVALGISHEARVLSAHRTPRELAKYVDSLAGRGVKVVIAAAGMAAHLAGVIAANTLLPVIGVPLASGPLLGMDALLAVSQMPGGVPVACVAIGEAGARNAAFLAARILGLEDPTIHRALASAVAAARDKVLASTIGKS